MRARPATRRLRCPRASFSCVDCSVTFVGTSYRDHTSCISEAEKYQKALYKPKAATGAPSAAAEASPKRPASATKARTTPKADRKKAYWEESTTDDDSDDDSHKKAAAKRRAAAATPEPVAAMAQTDAAPIAAGAPITFHWDDKAEKELKKIPFFVRGKARRNTERFASERGVATITIETLYDAKAHFSR